LFNINVVNPIRQWLLHTQLLNTLHFVCRISLWVLYDSENTDDYFSIWYEQVRLCNGNTCCVFFEVRTEFLNIIYIYFRLQRVNWSCIKCALQYYMHNEKKLHNSFEKQWNDILRHFAYRFVLLFSILFKDSVTNSHYIALDDLIIVNNDVFQHPVALL
jgi:hypothetical protein